MSTGAAVDPDAVAGDTVPADAAPAGADADDVAADTVDADANADADDVAAEAVDADTVDAAAVAPADRAEPKAVDPSVALLAREAQSFVARLRLFTPARWQATCPPYGTRADAAHHLAQWFADQVGEAPVRLPRLESDLALPDQLAVTADDLVRAGQPAYDAVAHLLLHRAELLDEPVPAGLVAALGETDERALLVRARRVCGAS